MSAPEVQAPLGIQLNLPTPIPSTRVTPFSHPEDQPLPARTLSQPIGESSQGPSFGRRTQSESALNHLSLPALAHRSPSAADNAAPDQPDSAPSPVPTEIIPQELTQEEIVEDIQRSGIQVRDYAYTSSVPPAQRAPELFDPVLALYVYEALLENTNPTRNPLNGRHLRRLLDLGWVDEEADSHRWLEQDREALAKFDSVPHYPWNALHLPKPKREELREVATARFQWVNADQLVPQFVNRGVPRITAVVRGPRNTPRYQKRPVKEATETENDPEISPKKRRLSTTMALHTSSSSQPIPGALAHVPLTLVNGKPPQQFPAGRPSDNPPRPTPPPQQGFSRSLQRHLSMASVSSSYPPSLTRSDSRTPLTQGTHRD